MSAYHCSAEHLAILVAWASDHRRPSPVRYYFGGAWVELANDPARAFAVLGNENARSVAHRYREAPTPFNFKYSRPCIASDADPRAIVRGCDCLDYQSCETDDWKQTEAYAILNAIRERAILQLCAGCEVWDLTAKALDPRAAVSEAQHA